MASWFYKQNGQQFGPIDTAELKRMAIEGELNPSDLIWREGFKTWVPASRAQGIYPQPAVPPKPDDFAVVSSAKIPMEGPARAAAVEHYTCVTCSGLFSINDVYDDNGTTICKRCFAQRTSFGPSVVVNVAAPNNAIQQPLGTASYPGAGLIAAGYICAGVSLLFCPPGFGVAGIVIGIINLARGAVGHGIAQIVLSICCTTIGMALGAATFINSFG